MNPNQQGPDSGAQNEGADRPAASEQSAAPGAGAGVRQQGGAQSSQGGAQQAGKPGSQQAGAQGTGGAKQGSTQSAQPGSQQSGVQRGSGQQRDESGRQREPSAPGDALPRAGNRQSGADENQTGRQSGRGDIERDDE